VRRGIPGGILIHGVGSCVTLIAQGTTSALPSGRLPRPCKSGAQGSRPELPQLLASFREHLDEMATLSLEEVPLEYGNLITDRKAGLDVCSL
jgi:hypothetical protein